MMMEKGFAAKRTARRSDCERSTLHKVDDFSVEFLRLVQHCQMAALIDKMHIQAGLQISQQSEPLGSVGPIIFCVEVQLSCLRPRKAFPQGRIAWVPVRLALSRLEKRVKAFPSAQPVPQLHELLCNQGLVEEIFFQ